VAESPPPRPAGLHPVVGHEALQERLVRAVRTGRLPGSLLLHGPTGIGKQRLALWLGQLLLCDEEAACGECRSCRLSLHLEHPDLHWFFPLPRPKGASGPEKLREKLEEARFEELAERRSLSLTVRDFDSATGIYLAAVQEIKARASRRPAMGRRTVFVVGDAEAMVPQAASPEAANAFLKLLEEPPADTHLLLTSSRPGALLPTIRSRTLGLRVAPVSIGAVERLLVEHAGVDAEKAAAAARQSQGAPGRALRVLSDESRAIRDRAAALIRAGLSSDRADRWAFAATLSPRGARGEFDDVLAAATEILRDLLARSLGLPELGFEPETAASLDGGSPPPAHALLRALALVEEAREEAARNLNPQAITAGLLSQLGGALHSA
jgi:DNA polymerase-3 subunit delta'